MAQESPLSATGALTEAQYEGLAQPQGPDGIVGNPNDSPVATILGGQIAIKAGVAGLLRGFPWGSGPDVTFHTPDLSGAARTDLVVLRLRRDDGYRVETGLRAGTPGAGAPAPVAGLGPTDWYEMPLAEYDVAGGVITQIRNRAWHLGEDGQLLCKSDCRPPHNPGRRIREMDTGRTYESNGTNWVVVLDDSGVTSVTLSGGWSASINRLQRRNGWSFAGLSVQRTGASLAAGARGTVGTLPAGFRPPFDVETTANVSPSETATVTIRATGAVEVVATAGIATSRFVVMSASSWPTA
ncbi:hypothetical protein AB0J27_20305 [Micromonospora chokoriensis]